MWHALFINIWQLSAICLLTSSPLHLSSSFRLDGGRRIFSKNIWLGSSPGCGWSTQRHSLCISHSCCVLRVTFLLESKPSTQSEVLNALDCVFTVVLFLFWWVPQSLPLKNSPTAWGCYQHTLLLGWSAGDEQSWFPSKTMLRIEVHQIRESCFSESEGPLGAFL